MLPLIFVPPGTPCFLVAGHAISPDSVFDDVKVLTGHGRKRRIYTVAPRVVQVGLVLEEDEMQAFDNWFENTLQVGNEKFTAEIAKLGVGNEYWEAQWVEPYVAEPMHLGRWRVSGSLLLTGEPSAVRPDTGVLTLEIEIALGAQAIVIGQNDLELEIELGLGVVASLSLEIAIGLGVSLVGEQIVRPGVASLEFLGRTPVASVTRAVLPGIGSMSVAGLAPTATVSASMVLLLHFNGANGSTTLVDSSVNARTSTAHGSVALTTTTPQFGTASGNFPGGTGDYWTFPHSSDFDFGAGDFTMEGWLWVSGGSGTFRYIISNRDSVGPLDGGFYMFVDSANQVRFRAIDVSGTALFDMASPTNALGSAAWHAVSVVRDGINVYMYVDGVLAGTQLCGAGAISATAEDLNFGNAPADNRTWNGKMDEWRITKGACLYPGGTTYTPSGPFP